MLDVAKILLTLVLAIILAPWLYCIVAYVVLRVVAFYFGKAIPKYDIYFSWVESKILK